jgi:hypothetical protein
MNDLVVSGWYQSLVDDCSAIVTEAVHNSRWELIVGYHALGRRITEDQDYQKFAKGNRSVCNAIANSIGQSERTLYYAIQFYTKYPNPDAWPFNKNMSWTKITKLLPDGKHTEARTFNQRLSSFETSLGNFLDKYPGNRDDIIRAIWRVIGGEWR